MLFNIGSYAFFPIYITGLGVTLAINIFLSQKMTSPEQRSKREEQIAPRSCPVCGADLLVIGQNFCGIYGVRVEKSIFVG